MLHAALFKRFVFSIPILLFFMTLLSCQASMQGIQKDALLPKMDTLAVIQKAKRHHAYWNENWVSPPALSFDEKERTWTVHSVKTHHTNLGDCKQTNGCTVVKSVTLVIDDKKGKVVSKTKEKKIFPNYE